MSNRGKTEQPRRTRIGSLVAAARVKRGQSKCAASRAIGVAPMTVTNWEVHGKRPLRAHASALAAYLEMAEVDVTRLCARPRKGAK